METWQMLEILKEELGAETLLQEVFNYFGNWDMEDCFKSIAKDYEVELELEEE